MPAPVNQLLTWQETINRLAAELQEVGDEMLETCDKSIDMEDDQLMSIGDLKEILKDFPDDLLVRFHTAECANMTLLSAYKAGDLAQEKYIEIDLGYSEDYE